MTNLFSGSRTVVDEHEGGEDIGGQADDGDEVWGDPGRNSSHQPFPVTLHERLQQGASSAAVPAETVNRQVRTWWFYSGDSPELQEKSRNMMMMMLES